MSASVGVAPVLSATSLKSFLRCPQQYWFSHVEAIKAKPSVKLTLGIAAHSGVEHNFAQKIESHEDLPVGDVIDAFTTSYDYQLAEYDTKPDEDPIKARDQGVRLMQLHHLEVAPKTQPKWVERQSIIRVISTHEEECDGTGSATCDCGVPFSATLDLVDDEDQVRDLKTTQRTPPEGLGQHLLQVAGGAMAYEAETGTPVNDLIIDYLIRTKVPNYHQERWGGPVDAHMRRVFAKQVENAYGMINAGFFPATGAEAGPGGPCSWCGYGPKGIDICEVWRKPK